MIDQWASDFWNMTIVRGGAGTGSVEECDVACILLPATEHQAIHDEEEFGAKVMDLRVEYARETGPEVGISRPITAVDVDPLAMISRTAFRGLTRFYADPHFDNDRCDEMYQVWFHANVTDPNVEVLMVGDGSGPAGFVTVSLATEEASIVLIAVAEHARGQGMGENLTRAAVNHAYRLGIPSISVVTQGCNIPSQRAFQAAGFRLRSSGVWMHRWFS